MTYSVEEVRDYWDSHLNLTQFLGEEGVAIGSESFFSGLERAMERFEYKDRLLGGFARGCEGQRLLEVGCGLGLELGKLAGLGFEVTGIDLAPRAVELANGYLRSREIHGRALVQNAERMEFEDGEFDAVYSSGVLQHTPDVEKAIAEIWRVLKPGGKVLIILYHRRSWFYLLHRVGGQNIEFEDEDAPIIEAYTKREVSRLFSEFDDVRVGCEYHWPTPTPRRGALPLLYNRLFVPAMRALPTRLLRSIGWHLILEARKPSAC